MNNVRHFIIYSAFILCVYQHAYSYPTEEAAVNIASVSSTATLDAFMGDFSIACSYISVVRRVYRIGKELKKHTFPTIEEKAYAEKMAEKYILITAENELQKCLINNRNSEARNSFGLPTSCEDIARLFSMLGGKSEVDKMTTIYNQYRTEPKG